MSITRVGVGIMEQRNENSVSNFDTDLGAIVSAGAMFTARGFSHSTIGTLVIGGIYVDERAAKEIAQYHARFIAANHEPPLKASSEAPPVRGRPSCASASDYALKAITFEIP